MRKFFSDSNPVIRGLTKLADLMWLNALFIITSLPVFTIGAATAALYYESMRVVSGEESYITKDFFKAFKDNFKYATCVWVVSALLVTLFGCAFYILGKSDLSYAHVGMGILGIPIILIAFMLLYVFPIMSKFENTLMNTVINALLISLAQFPKTILMLAFSAVPVLLVLSSWNWFPLLILGGFAIVAYVNGSFMNRIFEKLQNIDA
ncbi:MAG: YesL family protein [Lachnospiraceae bacterium]|nr:YesL family protein [Lachnospiraceae bacterium]